MYEHILIRVLRILDSIHLQKHIQSIFKLTHTYWSNIMKPVWKVYMCAEVQTEEENTASESQMLLYMKKEPQYWHWDVSHSKRTMILNMWKQR